MGGKRDGLINAEISNYEIKHHLLGPIFNGAYYHKSKRGSFYMWRQKRQVVFFDENASDHRNNYIKLNPSLLPKQINLT